jgi:hypothetical protein
MIASRIRKGLNIPTMKVIFLQCMVGRMHQSKTGDNSCQTKQYIQSNGTAVSTRPFFELFASDTHHTPIVQVVVAAAKLAAAA